MADNAHYVNSRSVLRAQRLSVAADTLALIVKEPETMSDSTIPPISHAQKREPNAPPPAGAVAAKSAAPSTHQRPTPPAAAVRDTDRVPVGQRRPIDNPAVAGAVRRANLGLGAGALVMIGSVATAVITSAGVAAAVAAAAPVAIGLAVAGALVGALAPKAAATLTTRIESFLTRLVTRS